VNQAQASIRGSTPRWATPCAAKPKSSAASCANTSSCAPQKELADRLELAEQQIQRWEATNYAGVGVERMQNVADALGARITEKISFGTPTRAAQRERDTARHDDAVPGNRVRAAD